jgi:hypothetical protein
LLFGPIGKERALAAENLDAALMQTILGSVAVNGEAVWLRLCCKRQARQSTAWEAKRCEFSREISRSQTASLVLTAAADFHHVGLIRFLAVLAAVFAVLLARAVAWAMQAFVGRNFVGH